MEPGQSLVITLQVIMRKFRVRERGSASPAPVTLEQEWHGQPPGCLLGQSRCIGLSVVHMSVSLLGPASGLLPFAAGLPSLAIFRW